MKKRLFLILKILISVIIVIGVYALAVNFYMKSYVKNSIVTLEEAKDLDDVDAVLVLGCLVREDGTLSGMLQDRLDTALAIESKAPYIMSGDHGRESYDEVNAMRDYAVKNGVSSERVFMDHAGFSTYDSIYRAKEIFSAKKIIIVTQKYHLYRALYIAKTLGIDCIGVPADIHTYYGQTLRDVREVLARNKDFLYCAFKGTPKFLGEKIDLSADGGEVTKG